VIYGVGTDLVSVHRLQAMYRRHGERALPRLLSAAEMVELRGRGLGEADTGRFLAKRFAAKEAFAKAMGTGVRAPVSLTAISVLHDALGKPSLGFAPPLAALMAERQLRAHLSLSDEADQVLAFAVVEFVGREE
jgi:holo-[acyl-carrier protein] synthase